MAVLKINLLSRSNFRMGRFLGESFGGISSRVGGVSLYEFGGDMLEPEVKVLWFQEGDWRLGVCLGTFLKTVIKKQFSKIVL